MTRDGLNSRSIELKDEVEYKIQYWWSRVMANTMDKYEQIFP